MIDFIYIVVGLFTLLFTILSFLSQYKRRSKLFYKPCESISINKSLKEKGFDIKYNDEPISNDMLVFSGKIICKRCDINTVKNEITVSGPHDCKWIKIYVDNNNCQATAHISDQDAQEAIITFNELRKNESFIINMLFQSHGDVPDNSVETVHNEIKFDHKIRETDDVKVISDYFSIIQALKHVTIGFLIPVFVFFGLLVLLQHLFHLSYSQVTFLYLVFVSGLCTFILLKDKEKIR